MTLTKNATEILNGTIESVKSILPFEISINKPSQISAPFFQESFGVLIGITGDLRGRIIIDGNEHIFSKVGETMFGMLLEGEMLESFSGELGNMIAGNLSTFVSKNGIEMDITGLPRTGASIGLEGSGSSIVCRGRSLRDTCICQRSKCQRISRDRGWGRGKGRGGGDDRCRSRRACVCRCVGDCRSHN